MTLLDGPSGVPTGRAGAPPRPRRRRWRPVVVTPAVLIAAVAVAVAVNASGRLSSAGPLSTDDAPGVNDTVGVYELRVGQTFCYGSVLLFNPSGPTATLESVQVHGGAGLTVHTPQVVGPDRTDTLATALACPASTLPLKGYTVPAGSGVGEDQGVEVMLPITLNRPGMSRIDGITVTYRAGGKTYLVDGATDVVACTYDCDSELGGR
jgi:hypothetical protein